MEGARGDSRSGAGMTRKEDAGMAEGRVRMWRRWGRECGEVRGRDAALVLCSARFPLGGGNDEKEGARV